MTKDTTLSLLRSVLTLAGTYLIGHNLLGLTVDSSTWQIILGAVVALGSTLWGIFDKSVGIEQLQSALRSIIISVGGLFVASGKLKGEVLEGIIGLITALIPVIQSYTSKVKNEQLVKGDVALTAAGKMVDNKGTPGTTVQTVADPNPKK